MRKWISASAVVLAVLLPGELFAEETQKDSRSDVVMKEVVVTGTRFEEKIERIPSNITVIDEEDIKNSNAKTIPDLLRSEQGIAVRDWTGNRKQVEVDLRGFGESASSNVLVLVDGRRVNQIDLSGVDWTQIPIENVERIEIVRGTGSVLYGDNAVGGVINILTKIPSRKFAFSAGANFGSYGLNADRFSVSGGQGKFTGSLYGAYESTDGYRENSEYRAKDLGGKILFDASDRLTFNLSGSFHSDDFGLPGYLTLAQLNTDRRSTQSPLDGGSTTDRYLKLGFDLALGDNGSLVNDISYRKRQTDTDWISFNFVQESQIDTWAFLPRYILKADVIGHSNTLVVGLDTYRSDQDIKSYSGNPPLPSGLSDIQRESYGLYITDEYSIMESLILSLGARYERVEYDLNQRDLTGFLAPLDAKVEENASAYSAGLSWLYSGKSFLFTRVNQSFRFPLTDEIVLTDYAQQIIRVNAALKPQKGRHYEIGFRHHLTPSIQASGTVFRAKIKDEIFLNPATFTNENYEETLHQGVEVGGKADFFGRLTLFGNYTYEKATFNGGPFDSKDIPAVPRHKYNVGARVHDLVPDLVFTAAYNYVGSSYFISDQANQSEKLDAYYTLDLRLSYAWRWINAFAGVNNLTNEKYSQYGVLGGVTPVFYPAPERNWIGGVQFVF